ncbi:helix-turn-helix domain-containing protein, partial [Corynebacterium glutamicum]
GKYSGRKKALSPAQIKQAHDRIDAGESKTAVAQDLGVGRATLYRYLMTDNKR